MIERIVSGGQTGADRGGLDAALELDIAHGGHCPRGRRAEDGAIPARYQLTETASPRYAERTERNVIDSDATLVVTRGTPTGGTALTCRLARKHARPLLVVDLAVRACSPTAEIRRWLTENRVAVLNVAGPRESSCPGIAGDVKALLIDVFGSDDWYSGAGV